MVNYQKFSNYQNWRIYNKQMIDSNAVSSDHSFLTKFSKNTPSYVQGLNSFNKIIYFQNQIYKVEVMSMLQELNINNFHIQSDAVCNYSYSEVTQIRENIKQKYISSLVTQDQQSLFMDLFDRLFPHWTGTDVMIETAFELKTTESSENTYENCQTILKGIGGYINGSSQQWVIEDYLEVKQSFENQNHVRFYFDISTAPLNAQEEKKLFVNASAYSINKDFEKSITQIIFQVLTAKVIDKREYKAKIESQQYNDHLPLPQVQPLLYDELQQGWKKSVFVLFVNQSITEDDFRKQFNKYAAVLKIVFKQLGSILHVVGYNGRNIEHLVRNVYKNTLYSIYQRFQQVLTEYNEMKEDFNKYKQDMLVLQESVKELQQNTLAISTAVQQNTNNK